MSEKVKEDDLSPIVHVVVGFIVVLLSVFFLGPCVAIDAIQEASQHAKDKVYCFTISSSNALLNGEHCFQWEGFKKEGRVIQNEN